MLDKRVYQELEFQVIELDSRKIILSIQNTLEMGLGTKLETLFPNFEVFIFCENMILSKDFHAKRLFISAFSIRTAAHSTPTTYAMHGRKVIVGETNLPQTTVNLLELFDRANERHFTLDAAAYSQGAVIVDQRIRMGLGTIDMSSFLSAHPMQCEMLLQKASTLYQEADPVVNPSALKDASTLLQRVIDRTNIHKGLKESDPLAIRYKQSEKNIGAANSIRRLAMVNATASSLLKQISAGNDFFGNSYDSVPLASFSFYKNLLGTVIPNYKSIEDLFLQFFNASKDDREKRNSFDAEKRALTQTISEAVNRIGILKETLADTNRNIIALQSHFNTRKQIVRTRIEQFQKELTENFRPNFESLFSSLTTLAFLSESPFGWAIAAGEITNSLVDDTKTIETDEKVKLQKEFLISKLVHLEGALSLPEITDQCRTLSNGEMESQEIGGKKLVVEQGKLESFLQDFYLQFPQGTSALRDAFQDFVDLVLERNSQIIYYNATVALIIKYHNSIRDAQAKLEAFSEASLQDYQPNLPEVSNFLRSIYDMGRSQAIESLYLTERALRFWSLSEERPISKLFAGVPITNVNAAVITEAQTEILRTYSRAVEHFGSNSQPFPPEGTEDDGIRWKFDETQLKTLKTVYEEEYGMMLKIPMARKTSDRAANAFAGMADVRITKVRAWLAGISTSDNCLFVTITHCGSESIASPQDLEFSFRHSSRKLNFRYRLTDRHILQDGDIGCSGNSETYALVGPFSWWRISILERDNPGIDMSKLTGGYLEFHGRCYPFN